MRPHARTALYLVPAFIILPGGIGSITGNYDKGYSSNLLKALTGYRILIQLRQPSSQYINAATPVIWEAINEVQPTKAKGLYEMNSGFWQHDWHERWRKQQYDRIYDKVESCVSDMALLEVEALGMENSPDLRKTLLKQFGGAGDDVRAREERYETGMPDYAGAPVFS